MRRWLAACGFLTILVYFGGVRESDAYGLRHRCLPCPAECEPCAAICAEAPAAETARPVPPPIQISPSAQPKAPPKAAPPKTPPKADVRTPPAQPKTQPKAAPPPVIAKPSRLYALLIVGSEDKDSGAAHAAGAKAFAGLLQSGLPKDRVEVSQLAGKDVTADAVRKRLAALSATAADTLVVGYFGPGVYDDAAKDLVLTLPSGNLPRGQVRAALLDKKARLTVLFTDPADSRAVPDKALPALPEPAAGPALERLFFRGRGVVDLQAAAVGERAFVRGDAGGLFTLAFVREAGKAADAAGWQEVFDATRKSTDALYKELRLAVLLSERLSPALKKTYRDQMAQTPVALTPLGGVTIEAAVPFPPIEVASEPPPPSADAPRKSADLVVRLPADARLFVDGRATEQSGPKRTFETPDLRVGKAYSYEVKVVAVRGTFTVAETRRVTVRAGETTAVDFDERSLSRDGVAEATKVAAPK
jgi:uncharacterized protein (TIGR03000 family)